MSWRTIVISNKCKLSYKNNYMLIRNENLNMIHLSEINTVVIDTTLVSITATLLCELMDRKIKVVFCDERYINVLEISEKELFKKIVYIVNKYSNNIEEGNDIVLLDNNNRLEPFKNILVVNDFYNIDVNSTKIIKSLYNEIEIQYNYEYGEENLLTNLENIFKNLQEILSSFDFELDYKREIRIPELLKCINLKFNEYYYDNPLENLICLFDLVSMFKLYKVMILVNVKSFFNDEEIIEIYKSALHRNIKLLLIE